MADDLLGGDDTNFAGEQDPAADFLARERDELGELGEEFGGETGNDVVSVTRVVHYVLLYTSL